MPSGQSKSQHPPTDGGAGPTTERMIGGVIARMIAPASVAPRLSTRFDRLTGARTPTIADPTDTNPHYAAIAAVSSRVIAVVVATIATLTLVGWLTHLQKLGSFGQTVAMNPASAVGFLTAAIALWLLRPTPWGGKQRTAAMILAAVPLFMGTIKLSSFFFHFDARFDRFLFTEQLGSNVMAPNTAVGFILIGASMLLLDVKIRPKIARPATAVAVAAFAIALIALSGYLYGVSNAYSISRFIPMALNTGVCFLLLAGGIMLARPGRQPVATIVSNTAGGVVARRLLPTAFILPLVVGWFCLLGHFDGRVRFEAAVIVMTFAITTIAVFVCLVWWIARYLYRLDLQRHRTEEALEDNYILMRTLIDNLPDFIFVKDVHGRFLVNNLAHVKILGAKSPDEVIGRTDSEFFDPHLAGKFRADDLHVIRSGESQISKEELVDDPSGKKRWVTATKTPFRNSQGDVVGIVGISHDITKRKQAEQLLEEKNHQLEESAVLERDAHSKLGETFAKLNQTHQQLALTHDALKQAQGRLVQSEKLAGLGQMVAGVAHEINNPLSFVSNNVAVLQRDLRGVTDLLGLYEKADEAIGRAMPELLAEINAHRERVDLVYTLGNVWDLLTRSREGLRRIQQIVKDLRDFARLDEGELQDADLNAGIESTINIIRGHAKKKRITIETDLGSIPYVTCHGAKINQVIMNLISNAIDASPEESVVRVKSEADREANVVRISVADQGTGIKPEILGRIFDPFFTTKKQGEGTGLGLAISYGIVQDHGGQLEVQSAVGKGSTFTVILPIKPVRS